MLHASSTVHARNAGRSNGRKIVRSGALATTNWRSGVSLLGLALAGAAIWAGPGRADTLDLNGATVQRVDFDHTPGAPYDIVQNGTFQLTNSGALGFAGTMRDNGGTGGIFSLQKYGNGTLTLTGTNTYSGETLLNAGTLAAGAVNVFSANSVLHSTGGAVDLAGFSQTVGGLFGPGLIVNTGAAAVTLNVQTASGLVGPLFGIRISETAGAIAVVKSGAGEQDQSNPSNYTGGTTLTGGTLGMGNSAALGTGAITFNGPATLSILGPGVSITNNIVLTSDGSIRRSGDVTTLSGIVSGAGGLLLPGTGSIVISGVNTYTGGTQTGGGVVGIGNDQAFGTGAIVVNTLTEFDSAANHSLLNNFTINDQLRLAVTGPASVLQLNGVLSGAGSVWLLPSTTGTLVLNSANTYTGGTFLSSGVLQVNNNKALGTSGVIAPTSATLRAGVAGLTTSNNITLQNTLTVDTNGNDYALTGTLQDLSTAGTLRKIGAGTLTLSGNNFYSGGTVVEAGVVAISADAGLGAGNGTLTLAGGDLELTGTTTAAMNRGIVLSGSGGAFRVDNLYSVINLSGTVSGGGTLSKQGLGTLNLLAANSYTGGTLASGGTLGVSAGALGTTAVTLVGSTLTALADNLSFANGITVTESSINTDVFNLALTGVIDGSHLTKFGTGTLTLSGNNTLASGVTVSDGGLAVGSNTALGPNSLGLYGGTSLIAAANGLVIANAIEAVSGAPITLDTRAATLTLNGDVNYTGPTGVTLVKAGSGTLIANGTWFGGAQEIVNVAAGTLQANGTLNTGQLNVASGATLSGSGKIILPGGGAAVTIADGGILSPGTAAPGTLTVDTLSLGAGTQVNFRLGKAGVAGGASNDLVVVNGQLTLAGTLNVANGPFFTSGNYTLFTYGTITNNGLTLGTLPSGYTGTVAIVAGDGAGGSVLLQAQGNSVQYWDGNGALADHVVSGGSGTWNSGSFNWASADGGSNSVWNNQQAIFGTVGGAVTVAGTQQFSRLQFTVDGYHLSGDGLSAVGGGSVPVPEINIADGASAIVDNVITGTAGLLKSGAGKLTLNGNNALSGAVSVSGGSVVAGNGNAFGSDVVTFADGTALGAGAAITLANNLTLGGGVAVDSNNFGLVLSGAIGGAGALTVVDTGATPQAGLVTLSGSNSYTGGTTINNARVSVAADAALGDAGGSLALGGGSLLTTASFASTRAIGLTGDSSFVPAGGTTLTLNGVIGGTGSLRQAGAGTLVLGGTNSFGGGTFVTAGILSIGNDANLGAAAGGLSLLGATLQATDNITSQRTVTIAGANTIDTGAGVLTLAGPITGAGSVTKAGAGNLVLTGSNSYAGATTVAAGTLTVNGSNAGPGAVGVNSGATLTGGGSIAGVVTVASGATLSPGNGVGTLTTGGLVLAGGSALAYQLGQANVVGGAFNDLLQVNGNLTLGGGLTVTDSGAFGNGVYRLINYTGALTDNGLAITSLPGGNTGQIQTAIGGTVNLLVTGPGALVQYWDGPDMAGNGKIDGGSGSWTAAGTNWTSAAPSTINSSWTGGVAVFSGTAGNVAVIGTQAFQGLQFASAGYVLTGGTLAASTGAFIATNGGTTTIGGSITGSGALSKQGAGNLTLNGSNSFNGLNVGAGSVTLGTNTAGGTGSITLADGTTLAAGTDGLMLANAVGTAGAGTLDSGVGTFTLNGVVSGPGSIAKVGSGNLVLNAANSFSGLGVNMGIVTLGTNTAGGTGGIALADGTTLAAGVSGLVLANAVSTAGVGTLNSGSGMFTLNGIVSGPGSIAKAGSGNLVLNGINGFAGLAVNGGSVTLGTSTAAGVGSIALADGTALVAGVDGLILANAVSTAGVGTVDAGSGAFTLNGTITGAGSIRKAGSGNLVLTGANSFNGLAVGTGTVTVGTNTAGGSGAITLADGTTLAAGTSGLVLANAVSTAGVGTLDSGAGMFTFTGPITGAGSITKVSTGNLVLNGSNGFAGLNVSAGSVTVGSNTAAGSGNIALADGTTLAAGTTGLVLANMVTMAGAGTVDSGAGVFTLNGAVSGPGAIVKAGSGNLVLNGSNSFAGLGVGAGTVTVGSSTAAGTGTIALAGGTTLAAGGAGLTLANAVTTAGVGTVNTNGFDLALSGPITGPGSIVETGTGSLNLGGVSSYAGATTVAGGQLRVTGSLTNSVVMLASGTSIRGTGSVAGLVASSGSTVAPGLGTTIGTLAVTGNAVFQPGATFAVNVGATTADRLTVGGTAALAGTLALNQVVGPLTPFTSYTLLTAAGGRTGTFGTVSYGNAVYNAAFTPTVSYTTTAVLLGLQAKSLVVQVGNGVLTPNERNVAAAYDAAIATGYNPSAFAALFAPGLNLPDALNQLSGEVHSAERRVAMDDTRHVREAALDRLGGGLAATPGKDDSAATSEHDGHSYTLWARGVGSWGTNRSDGNGSAFNTSTGGAIVGIDMGFDGGKIGALFNYTTTTLDRYTLGRSRVESTGGGIYAGYRQDHGFAAAAGAAISGIKARSNRTITVPGLGQNLAGRSDGNTYQAFADVSYDLATSAGTQIEPFARFAWVSLDTAAFTETGGSGALTASHGSASTQIATAGLRGAVALKGFTIKASAGAQHTGGDRSPVALLALAGSNSPASISAVPVDKWALAADVSGEFRLARNTTFAVGYSGVNGKRTRDNGVRGTLTFGF